MEGKRLNVTLWWLSPKSFFICLSVLLFSVTLVQTTTAQSEDVFESTDPVLISESGSTRALAINPDNWAAGLPDKTSDIFQPGSRVTVFVANIGLLRGEGANAFRVFASDAAGKKYRLTVEDIRRRSKRDQIYGLTLRIYDTNGYNGQPQADGEVLIWVSWRGNTSNRVRLRLGRSGRVIPNSGAVPTPASSILAPAAQRQSTGGDRKRFMEQAAFGPSSSLDFRLRQLGIRRWIDDQFDEPYPSIPYPNAPLATFDVNVYCGGMYGTNPEVNRCHRDVGSYPLRNWLVQEALYGDDQLRRRVSWALHQIWVVSATTVWQQRWLQEYIEILDRNSFGNYRDLMEEMTLSPAMGEYLDMVRSTRQNPNENYPRELLQLFTVGLYMLNQDGSPILDNQGNRIATYDQDKIDQFTKVFTGWTRCDNGLVPACANAALGSPNFIDPMHLSAPENHDPNAKSLFAYPNAPNSTIAACVNCTTFSSYINYANDSLDRTLDNIFYHPNVGPFFGKLMIQHLVTSDPTPAYVSRVASAFNNNGSGVRGDMKSVIRAVLLDPEARGSLKTDPAYGKMREPFQFATNILRHFNARAGTHAQNVGLATPPASCQNMSDGVFEWVTREMGQDILNSPTVFNYFAPDYVVPGTDILGPEFALANTGSSFAKNNHTMGFLFWDGVWFQQPTPADPYPYVPCGTAVDRSEAIAWATADPTGNRLVDGLNTKLMHGTMSPAMKAKIMTAINFNQSADNKARQAIYLVASSSQYQIQR